MSLIHQTAAEMADALAAGTVTSVELTQAHLDRRKSPTSVVVTQVTLQSPRAHRSHAERVLGFAGA